jgi:TPR repeat protein
LVLLAGVSVASAHGARSQDFSVGLSAYNSADYEAAVDQWLPLARRGHSKAQAAMGFLFHKGLGVAQSDAVAAVWYRRAAEQGEAHSQLFLGTLYYLGSGVPQDHVRAHMWCDLAISGGVWQGLDCRDAAAAGMTAEDICASRNRGRPCDSAFRCSKKQANDV